MKRVFETAEVRTEEVGIPYCCCKDMRKARKPNYSLCRGTESKWLADVALPGLGLP